jgi:hypothetical protein
MGAVASSVAAGPGGSLQATLDAVLPAALVVELRTLDLKACCGAATIDHLGALKAGLEAVLAQVVEELDDKVKAEAELPHDVASLLMGEVVGGAGDNEDYMRCGMATTQHVLRVIPHAHLSSLARRQVRRILAFDPCVCSRVSRATKTVCDARREADFHTPFADRRTTHSFHMHTCSRTRLQRVAGT